MDDLDKIDRRILDLLAKDGRITVTELAKQVGLSKTPCQIRMRKLEEAGYIVGYVAVLDPERLGEGHIAFVQVSLTDTRSDALHAFNEAVRQIREVEQCHMIASNFDYLLKIRTRDMSTYRKVLGEKDLSPPPCLPYLHLRGDGEHQGSRIKAACVRGDGGDGGRRRLSHFMCCGRFEFKALHSSKVFLLLCSLVGNEPALYRY